MADNHTIKRVFREPEFINGNTLVKLNGLQVSHKSLRLDVPIKYEFPDVVEIKVTDRCIHSCLYCHEGCREYGNNTFKSEIYDKLNTLPDKPIMFVLSGGCILENLTGLKDIINFLDHKFLSPPICVKINFLDLERINNLPETFGKQLTNVLLYRPNYFLLSINQVLNLDFEKITESGLLDRFSPDSNIIWRFDHTKFPFEVIESVLNKKIYSGVKYLVEGGTGALCQEDKIKEFLDKQRYHIRKPYILFDSDAYSQLNLDDFLQPSEKDIYSLGWDNYVYFDAVRGEYRKDRLSKGIDWKDYDTSN